MQTTLFDSLIATLNKADALLEAVAIDVYTDTSVGPYYSSIGSHMRHVLDFFGCISDGVATDSIDLSVRKRDESIANNPTLAREAIACLIQTITIYHKKDTHKLLHVKDNVGTGITTVAYSLESILASANSHAIHHFAMIGYILHALEVLLPIPDFGYNPTTPVLKMVEV